MRTALFEVLRYLISMKCKVAKGTRCMASERWESEEILTLWLPYISGFIVVCHTENELGHLQKLIEGSSTTFINKSEPAS